MKREALEDLLLHRYGQIDYVLHLPARRAAKLIETANEEEHREQYFRRYLVYLPNMTKENFISFERFYEQFQPVHYDNRPKEEIMQEILGRRG